MPYRDKKSRGSVGGYSRGGRGYRRGSGNSNRDSSDNPGHRGGYRGRSYKRPQANHSYDGKRKKYEVTKRLIEDDVGVTEFIGNHKRFGGIVKERFGDFNVHEISCDGTICKLTTQEIPPEPAELENLEKLKECIPTEIRDKLETFIAPDSKLSMLEIDVTELDKDTRRNIHGIAKTIPSVVSETVEKDDKKIIVLAKKNKQSSHKFRGDKRIDWSSREGNYCHFLLHKVNMDTMDALNQLAAKLRMRSDNFNYAGTKDRRARTTQWVSLKKVPPKTIHAAAKQVRGAHVGNFKFAKEPLKLGMLNGNRFRIALRSVDGTDEDIENAVNSLRNNGFINYYGLQRFGTVAAIPTHEIGKALLKGKWNEAIDLILKPREGEQQDDIIEAREIYQKTKDATAALKPIKWSGKFEAKLLQGIANCGDENPLGALDHLPRNVRLMYIHSYQSLVWNHMVSRRIREFGAKPIVGDLVYEKTEAKDDAETMDWVVVPNDAMKEEENVEKTVEDVEIVEKVDEKKKKDESEVVSEKKDSNYDVPVEEISEMNVSNDENDGQSNSVQKETETDETIDDSKDITDLPAVKALTEEDLTNYTLADVVMPKPGSGVTYPEYAKSWYEEFLAKDGLTTDLKQKNRKYSLGGGYRKMLQTPVDFTWKIVPYNGYHDDLILCDLDEMRGVTLPEQEPDAKHKALILEFSLESSAYATMALREIIELDTSAHTQATQSAANQAEEQRQDEEAKKSETDAELLVINNGVNTKTPEDNEKISEDNNDAKETVDSKSELEKAKDVKENNMEVVDETNISSSATDDENIKTSEITAVKSTNDA